MDVVQGGVGSQIGVELCSGDDVVAVVRLLALGFRPQFSSFIDVCHQEQKSLNIVMSRCVLFHCVCSNLFAA